MDTKPEFRNIFHSDEEPLAWKSKIDQFPNKVPRFATKEEAAEFIVKASTNGSNPDYPDLKHSISTLVDWNQIKTHLIPKITEYDSKWQQVQANKMQCKNRFLEELGDNTKIAA